MNHFFTSDAFVVEHGCDSHNDSDFCTSNRSYIINSLILYIFFQALEASFIGIDKQ